MKIFCIGRNYAEHAKELNNELPENPVIFMKPPTALLRQNADFYHPDFSKNIHHEIEIVLKIDKNGKSISPKFAPNYYTHLALGIDFTARDLQNELKAKGLPWEIAKAFDHSAPISDFVPIAEFNDLNNLQFELKKNGVTVQNGTTANLIFSFNYLISYISKFFTLHTGDLIFTGTPAGVGKVTIGDTLEGFIENKKMLICNIK